MKKSALRMEFKARRNSFSTIEKQSFDLMLLQQIKNYPFNDINYLLSYYPIEKHNEPNTFLLSGYLKEQFPAMHICKPRINEAGLMDAVYVNKHTDFEKNKYDIPEPITDHLVEPEKIDVVFVPLLAFDTRGYRVGYGKGYYDKYLPKCNNNILKIGISYFQPVHNIEDTNEYDIPLNLCFTPFEVYEFKCNLS